MTARTKPQVKWHLWADDGSVALIGPRVEKCSRCYALVAVDDLQAHHRVAHGNGED